MFCLWTVILKLLACTFELTHLGGKLVTTHFVVSFMNKRMILKVTCSLSHLPLSAWTCVFTHFQPVSHHVDVLPAILILHHQQFDLYIWLDFWNMISIINMVCHAFQLHFWTYKFSVNKLIYLLFWCIIETSYDQWHWKCFALFSYALLKSEPCI